MANGKRPLQDESRRTIKDQKVQSSAKKHHVQSSSDRSDIEQQSKQQNLDTFDDNPDNCKQEETIVHHNVLNEQKDADEEEYIIRLLARRSMHFPNNNWWKDWWQYMKNNHPLLGIFFHHPLHPLSVQNRLYILLASAAFGLSATNCVYLYYAFTDEEMDKILVQITLDESPLNFKKLEALEVTYGMVTLWTFGSIIHSLFDICIWYISACACFISGARCSKRGKLQVVGSYIVIAIAAMLVGIAFFAVFMRAAYDRRLRLAEQGIVLDDFQWQELGRVRNFSFLIGYVVEMGLTYFAYYPVLITALMVGVVPCFGRKKEMMKQYRERKAREQRYRKDDLRMNCE